MVFSSVFGTGGEEAQRKWSYYKLFFFPLLFLESIHPSVAQKRIGFSELVVRVIVARVTQKL